MSCIQVIERFLAPLSAYISRPLSSPDSMAHFR